MKFCIFILRASIVFLLTATVLYFAFYNWDKGPDPIEVESVLTVIFAAVGVGLSLLLVRKAYGIRGWVFAILFILYLFAFTFPALGTILFLLVFI